MGSMARFYSRDAALNRKSLGDPLVLPGGNIANGFADAPQCAEIVMRLHQLVIVLYILGINGANIDLVELQGGASCAVFELCLYPYFAGKFSTIVKALTGLL